MTVESAAPKIGTLLPEIRQLAAQEGLPVELIQQLYAAELERLRASARIPDFVPILATNRLKRRLRERRVPRPREAQAVALHDA